MFRFLRSAETGAPCGGPESGEHVCNHLSNNALSATFRTILIFELILQIVQLFFRNAATPGNIYYTDDVRLLITVPKNSLIATAWLQPNSIDELDFIIFILFDNYLRQRHTYILPICGYY